MEKFFVFVNQKSEIGSTPTFTNVFFFPGKMRKLFVRPKMIRINFTEYTVKYDNLILMIGTSLKLQLPRQVLDLELNFIRFQKKINLKVIH